MAGTWSTAIRSWCQGLLWLLWVCVGCVAAQDCQHQVTVAAVAGVFGTLAVVILVLAVTYFVLRKRNGGVLFRPKRTRKNSGLQVHDLQVDNHGGGIDNPVFPTQFTLSDEADRRENSAKRHSSPDKKSPVKDKHQTRTALSTGHDLSSAAIRRQGSRGSLDNYMNQETVTVSLQSHDIVGLGFNISGNMRDGIYVSQINNRGPAVESGKIQVGDRIISVTITYKNIVYEDALTILSYASPYPVQVTVQKERTASPDTRNVSSDQLIHPLYRSQSLDALQRISKEPIFRPKRTHSEMKSYTRKESPRKADEDKKFLALSQSFGGFPSSAAEDNIDVSSKILVHAAEMKGNLNSFHEVDLDSDHCESDDLVATKAEKIRSPFPTTSSKALLDVEANLEDAAGKKQSGLTAEASREFAGMMDQFLDRSVRKTPSEELIEDHTSASTSPKSPPSKPERKKKSSISSLGASDEAMAFFGNNFSVEETFQPVTAAVAQALPRSTEEDLGPEVEEELIKPSFVKRDIVIGSKTTEFTPVDKSETTERSPSPPNPVSWKMSDRKRPVSPEGQPVEEEPIQAAVASKDALGAAPPRLFREDDLEDEESEKRKRIKKKEKDKPQLDEEELEHLIAMNNFLPDSQGWEGIRLGGEPRGFEDDFVPRSFSQQVHKGQRHSGDSRSSSEMSSHRAGVAAFEIGEDALTGRMMSGDFLGSPSSSSASHRRGVTSFYNHQNLDTMEDDSTENSEDHLDWSGQRLVRSESFSEIPQDDSIREWIGHNKLVNDDDNSTTSGKRSTTDTNLESDSEVEIPRALSDKDVLRTPDSTVASMSDLSNSVSSSRSSSPPVTNGTTEPIDSRVPHSRLFAASVKNSALDSVSTSDSNANSLQPVSVTLNTSMEEDMDC